MVLVLANFPNERNRHEGMAQRVVAVDRQIQSVDRSYLFVSHRQFFIKQTETIDDRAVQYRCNLFRHFFFILKLLWKANTIYAHSVINLLPILPLFPFLRKKTLLILDAHGVVPEEQAFSGARLKSRLYALTERLAFKRADLVVVVTRAMESHFRTKYPEAMPTYVQYGIFPAHLQPEQQPVIAAHTEDEAVLRVVYSGNLQSWQNIDLMIQVMKSNLDDRIQYDILTGEPEELKRRLQAEGIAMDRICVQTVAPSALGDYYRAAHYGFVLRDDMVVNRVACPTKLVEYLYYGIIPIVSCANIGDFETLGYEYLPYEAFSTRVAARKSAINREVARELIERQRSIDFKNLLKES